MKIQPTFYYKIIPWIRYFFTTGKLRKLENRLEHIEKMLFPETGSTKEDDDDGRGKK